MIYSELLKAGLFEGVLTKLNDPNIDKIGFEKLTNLSLVKYGSRQVSMSFEDMNIETISDLIVIQYSEKWLELARVLNDLDVQSDITTVVSGNVEKLGTKTTNNETLNKLSGFNDDELIVDNGSESLLSDDVKDNEKKDSKTSIKNGVKVFENLNIKHEHNIMHAVTKDVNQFLNLNVY